ncbi:MAG: UDP-N-acetylmuramoyl-tripeptide--D-alanyl-D-alanine ligase [Candidatus Azambacteria bacterium]|nr:UDP-N-acetylmuramoyl-tripeptide--D-alanyl-D-alanine ligase [Candidatus Azambacteria bacterium]
MSYLFKKILIWLARAQIQKYKPMIIGVTGNAGKTSTKEAIAAVLRQNKIVRIAAGNLNNEFGFALTILGDWDQEYYDRGSSAGLWLRVLLAGFRGLFVRRDCAEIFLLEYGADRPGDIKRLAGIFKPHIAVVTTVGDIPVHIEFFSAKGGSQPKADQPLAGAKSSGGKNGADAVAAEKANLVDSLAVTDYAVLNHDDVRVFNMKPKTKAKVITYGFEEGATIRISDFKNLDTNESKPMGVSFKIHNSVDFESIKITGSLGKSQAYAAAAAAAVGMALNINFTKIVENLRQYHGPNGRLKILSGIKGSTIIDDTYNASPASMKLALETLRDSAGSRKIAALGNMLELGEYTMKAHQDIGALTVSFVDILVCVGVKARFIAEASKIAKEKVFIFNTADEAKFKIKDLIRENDIVLVKGSQGARMEKIVAEIMAEPQRKKEFLVRQSKNWLSK